MSTLRPTLHTGSSKPCVRGVTAYLMILNAIHPRKGLVHGALHSHGESCAIGSYFDINSNTSLPNELIDEVAMVNDSMPTLTEKQRRTRMMQWLKWKLADAGVPGFRRVMKVHEHSNSGRSEPHCPIGPVE